ncbi:uncharacterized protein EV420DRAFT_1644196 [Desarmillaria tabescens]|uniref:GATA-type domain-containing protein n=1 Tax=Armillaria tabescens TaxID=1929756 RepID=A0AA39KBZ5_ARMTA|nr:uncharacterized protein EV420DRAFT_1644196 [Desarmillaria tabescens]KAK0457046.1 hypothetical protein EV420DRAFT_1644196 [Desarmillaria tabescens]
MPSILNLKFKGNKSFVAFSNLNDSESLTKTWKVCTKVASYLEQGQRLENLSWRLWHLQNLMVDTDNAKSKREFKKLSKCMGDKLDKEKGRSIEELEAPDFKSSHSIEIIRQRAVEKERSREASQNAKPGTIKRMQFTFSVDQPSPAVNTPVQKPDLKPSPEFHKRPRAGARYESDDHDKDFSFTQRGRKEADQQYLRFPPIFSNDFGPTALLYPAPTLTTRMNYGEAHHPSGASSDGFSIMRPTIELPLDELLTNVDASESPPVASPSPPVSSYELPSQDMYNSAASAQQDTDIPMTNGSSSSSSSSSNTGLSDDSSSDSDDEDSDDFMAPLGKVPPIADTPATVAPFKVNSLLESIARSNTPTGRPSLTVRTSGTPNTRSSGPGATATSLNNSVLRSVTTTANNSAPGGVKAECSNCGATHTPLWRRGLNDELNCNACGLYCKLHKRPRPKTMRNTHGEGRTQSTPRQESVDVMAQCYNCHTTTTPLWRKDDEGKTVCNACGLYYKLHGSARPISMKSDVIRKRSRHDARRAANGSSDTPSASPGVSRRASPVRESSPTLAPDSTTQMTYEYNEEVEYRSTQSELMGALGQDMNQGPMYQSMFNFQFPGPYHPDQINQLALQADALPFATVDFESDQSLSQRKNKRRRMSTDSASEPPSSAVSYSSFTDGYSTASSATSHSQRSSMDFPFSNYASTSYGGGFRGVEDPFWHPPLQAQNDNSPQFCHPPMLPPDQDSPMDYLHPPAGNMPMQEEESFFSTYLHPPMMLPDDSPSNPMQGNGMQAMSPPALMYPGNTNDYRSHGYDTHMRTY